MENGNPLLIIKKGIPAWNQWRLERPDEKPSLGGANLFGTDLQGARLFKVDLQNADLREANLQGADLRWANLANANLRGANLKRANLEGAHLKGINISETNFQEAYLSRADFKGAIIQRSPNFEDANLQLANFEGVEGKGPLHCKGASLHGVNFQGTAIWGSNFEGADLMESNFEGADIRNANLKNATLRNANLRGTDLWGANLCSVSARFAIVDGATLLGDCIIDDATDFANVGLDSARIEGQLKAQLKHNIRKHHWEGYNHSGVIYRGRYANHPVLCLAWPFWWASNYGSSAARLLLVFCGMSALFALLYLIPTLVSLWSFWPAFEFEHPFVQGLDAYNGQELAFGLRCLRALYLSIVTMTTLGFGDITPHPLSYVGHILVIVQVCIGYVLLGALITRLAVLFQEVE